MYAVDQLCMRLSWCFTGYVTGRYKRDMGWGFLGVWKRSSFDPARYRKARTGRFLHLTGSDRIETQNSHDPHPLFVTTRDMGSIRDKCRNSCSRGFRSILRMLWLVDCRAKSLPISAGVHLTFTSGCPEATCLTCFFRHWRRSREQVLSLGVLTKSVIALIATPWLPSCSYSRW